MKILGVVGSPRRNGNTHLLVSRILEGAGEAGASVDTVFLNDLSIKECDGCHVCWKGKKCSKNDDMLDVYPKIIESDAIIFGTPVYWYGPTALMKAYSTDFMSGFWDSSRIPIGFSMISEGLKWLLPRGINTLNMVFFFGSLFTVINP